MLDWFRVYRSFRAPHWNEAIVEAGRASAQLSLSEVEQVLVTWSASNRHCLNP